MFSYHLALKLLATFFVNHVSLGFVTQFKFCFVHKIYLTVYLKICISLATYSQYIIGSKFQVLDFLENGFLGVDPFSLFTKFLFIVFQITNTKETQIDL